MPLDDWLRCPACGSPLVSLYEIPKPEVLLRCEECNRRATVEIEPIEAMGYEQRL